MKILKATRIERCIGCHVCSLSCARLVHGLLSWQVSGIRIKSSGGISTGFEATYCLACKEPICARSCPTGAISIRKAGGVRIRKDLCIRCSSCIEACPVNAITKTDHGFPVVCIHCGLCTNFCPHGCLEMIEAVSSQDVHDQGGQTGE